MDKHKLQVAINKVLPILPFIIIAAGILLRVLLYFQNNDFIIDEANVARNIYEKSYMELTQPLNYEQYAPPVFLWIIKLSTDLFGYSEYAFTIFPLLCSFLSLWLMYKVLKKYTDLNSIWYALLMMASGLMYVRYSVELKQYMSDVVIALSLILAALRMDILQMNRVKFILLWVLMGSAAIWLSMPSVFMLASIGLYYFMVLIRAKQYNHIISLAIISACWLGQFWLYYEAILKAQINSSYLQQFHEHYFLFALPKTADQWLHNWELSLAVLGNAAGHWAIPVVLHLLCITIAIVVMIRTGMLKGILLVAPIAIVFTAAAFNQFSLIPRVILFALPLILVLIAIGLSYLFKIRFIAVRVVVLVAAIISFVNFNRFDFIIHRMEFEEVTQSMNFLKKHNITGNELKLHHLVHPAYTYYTTMHPSKDKWKSLLGASVLVWDTDYDTLGASMKGRNAMMYNWEEETRIDGQQAVLNTYCPTVASLEVMGSKAFIYQCKE